MSRWRPLLSDPPLRTGKYIVGHRGQVIGTAHYFSARDIAQGKYQDCIKPGWFNLPPWHPTHWMPIPKFPDAVIQRWAGE